METKNNIVTLESRSGTKIPLCVIKASGRAMGDEKLNQDERRRSVTLDEQRIYNQLDAINAKLEKVIRHEEKIANIEKRVNIMETDVDLLNREKQATFLRLTHLEGIKDQVDVLIRQNQSKYEYISEKQQHIKEKQSALKSLVDTGIGVIKWVAGILVAAGIFNAVFDKDQKVEVKTEQHQKR